MAERRTWGGAIRSPGDVRAVLEGVNQAGHDKANTTALAHAVQPADDTQLTPDATRLLPAPEQLASLLPWPGLRRGATIAVTGSTSLLMLTLAAAMREGSWAAVVGAPSFGALAAGQDHGIPLDRLALVPDPGPDWPTVVAALLDGVDLVAVSAPTGVSEAVVRSLQARARQRGAVLLPLQAWPGVDLTLTATSRWEGLGQGHGRLRRQLVEVTAVGRGKAARPRKASMVLPPGAATRPARIPPPPLGLYEQPGTRESKLWARVEPNEPPPDAWAELVETVPAPGRKRR